MSLCKYKEAFGKPGEGIHRFRIYDFSVVDILVTLLGASLISYFSGVSLRYVIPFTFVFGVFVHRMLCVRTTVDRMLFPNA
jgi:hypothetical protein